MAVGGRIGKCLPERFGLLCAAWNTFMALELGSRVANAAGRAQARAGLIEKSDLSLWKFDSTIVYNGGIEGLEIICAGLTLDS